MRRALDKAGSCASSMSEVSAFLKCSSFDVSGVLAPQIWRLDVFAAALRWRSAGAGCAAASARLAGWFDGAIRIADGARGSDGVGDVLMGCGLALPFLRCWHFR